MAHSTTLLFLDFDGVLHPFPMPADPANLFCDLPRLEAVLRDFPAVQVVISSSWRERYSFSELARLFSPDIARRVVGILPVIEIRSLADTNKIRYREIQQFLAGMPANWIALDDDPSLFPNPCPHLIWCEEGFGEKEETELRHAMQLLQENSGWT